MTCNSWNLIVAYRKISRQGVWDGYTSAVVNQLWAWMFNSCKKKYSPIYQHPILQLVNNDFPGVICHCIYFNIYLANKLFRQKLILIGNLRNKIAPKLVWKLAYLFLLILRGHHKPALGGWSNSFETDLVLVLKKAFGSVVLSIP